MRYVGSQVVPGGQESPLPHWWAQTPATRQAAFGSVSVQLSVVAVAVQFSVHWPTICDVEPE
jgi:hypothetical protein